MCKIIIKTKGFFDIFSYTLGKHINSPTEISFWDTLLCFLFADLVPSTVLCTQDLFKCLESKPKGGKEVFFFKNIIPQVTDKDAKTLISGVIPPLAF